MACLRSVKFEGHDAAVVEETYEVWEEHSSGGATFHGNFGSERVFAEQQLAKFVERYGWHAGWCIKRAVTLRIKEPRS